MLNKTAIQNKDRLEIIEYNGLPLVAKSTTFNTHLNSTFLPVNVVIFLKRGSVKIYSDKESFNLRSGDYFFLPSYTDYKIQKILDPLSGDFQSTTFFIDHLSFTDDSIILINDNLEKLIHLFNLNGKATKRAFEIIEDQFKLKTTFSRADLDRLSDFVKNSKELTSSKAAASISNSEELIFLSFLFKNIGANITLEKLAFKYGLSTSSFHRLFIKRLGVSPHRWIKDLRLQYARCWLLFSQKLISEIYLDLGFEDISHFSKEFKKKFGYNPSKTTSTTKIEVIK